jgi:amino-acid N-acetyltransferase
VPEVSNREAHDLEAVRALLERNCLPTSDLVSGRPEFVVIWEGDELVAAGALQRFGSAALLRSVVVTEKRRRSGLGRSIVGELERRARLAGIKELILLTQTASAFFAARGYRVIERRTAPPEVQGSEEFRSLCPSSAVCMAKYLTASG